MFRLPHPASKVLNICERLQAVEIHKMVVLDMKVQWYRSATVGIYSQAGTSILCDPWITDGAFIGSWFHWPPLEGFEFEDTFCNATRKHSTKCNELGALRLGNDVDKPRNLAKSVTVE